MSFLYGIWIPTELGPLSLYDPLGESDLIFVYMMHIIHAFLTCNHLYLIKQRLFALENDFLPFL